MPFKRADLLPVLFSLVWLKYPERRVGYLASEVFEPFKRACLETSEACDGLFVDKHHRCHKLSTVSQIEATIQIVSINVVCQ